MPYRKIGMSGDIPILFFNPNHAAKVQNLCIIQTFIPSIFPLTRFMLFPTKFPLSYNLLGRKEIKKERQPLK